MNLLFLRIHQLKKDAGFDPRASHSSLLAVLGVDGGHCPGEEDLVHELELALVVELEQHGAVRVEVLDVLVVHHGILGGVAAVLAHVQLGAALLVGVGQLLPVNLALVGLQ